MEPLSDVEIITCANMFLARDNISEFKKLVEEITARKIYDKITPDLFFRLVNHIHIIDELPTEWFTICDAEKNNIILHYLENTTYPTFKIYKNLIKKVDVNHQNANGQTVGMVLLKYSYISFAKHYFALDVNYHLVSTAGDSYYHYIAAQKRTYKLYICKELVDQKNVLGHERLLSSTFVTSNSGETPLMIALRAKNFWWAQKFLTLGANPNTACDNLISPLEIVIKNNLSDNYARLLLKHGVNPRNKFSSGENAVEYVLKSERSNLLVDLWKTSDLKLSDRSDSGVTYAALFKNYFSTSNFELVMMFIIFYSDVELESRARKYLPDSVWYNPISLEKSCYRDILRDSLFFECSDNYFYMSKDEFINSLNYDKFKKISGRMFLFVIYFYLSTKDVGVILTDKYNHFLIEPRSEFSELYIVIQE